MNAAEIRALLPQRHPLLLVDAVESFEPDRHIVTRKAVSVTEPCYSRDCGHPAYPPALLLESFGQSAALLWLRSTGAVVDDDHVLMFVAGRGCRFLADVLPGDVVTHEVRLESVVADTAFVSGRSLVGDRVVAEYDQLVAARRPRAGVLAGWLPTVRPIGTTTEGVPA